MNSEDVKRQRSRSHSFVEVDDSFTIDAHQQKDKTNEEAKNQLSNEMIQFLKVLKNEFPNKINDKENLYKSFLALFSPENIQFKVGNDTRMQGDWKLSWDNAYKSVFENPEKSILENMSGLNPFKRKRNGGTKNKYKLKKYKNKTKKLSKNIKLKNIN